MSRRPTDEEIVEALLNGLGQVSRAAEKLDCPIDWIFRRVRKSRRLRSTLRLFRGKLLDHAERAIWQAVLDQESWAVKLAFELWGRSRDFTDGGEAWHAPGNAHSDIRPELVRELAEILMKNEKYPSASPTGGGDSHTGLICLTRQPGEVADGAAPGGD